MVAGAVLDFVAESSYEGISDVETVEATYGDGSSARTVATTSDVFEYPLGTLTITREHDDNDTPTDPTDDVITVTRELDFGFEANRVDVLVRPLRPTTDPAWQALWDTAPVDQIVQDGTVDHYIEVVLMAHGDVEATWAYLADVVYPEQIVREVSHVTRPNVVHRTIVFGSATGEVSVQKEKIVDGVVVHTFVVEPYIDPVTGQTVMRIVRDDGSYAIVRSSRSPRVIEYYNSDDDLVVVVEERRSPGTGTMVSTRTFYDATGAVTNVKTVTFSLNYRQGEEDSVQITRTAEGRTRVITITESGDVYVVDMRGQVYTVRVVDGSTVEFLDSDGNSFRTASRTADGGWQVATGSETVIL